MLKVSCQGHRRRTVFNHLCFDIAFIPFVDVSQLFRVDIVHIVAILRTAGSTGLVDKRPVNLERPVVVIVIRKAFKLRIDLPIGIVICNSRGTPFPDNIKPRRLGFRTR